MGILTTDLCRHFGIEHPIFGFAHDIATVAAITNAGGLGVYGATRRFPHEIDDELAEIRRLVGDKPFGVDLVLPEGMPEHNSRDAIEAHIPDEHRSFVKGIVDKYAVPEPSGPGMRTPFHPVNGDRGTTTRSRNGIQRRPLRLRYWRSSTCRRQGQGAWQDHGRLDWKPPPCS